MHSVSDLFWISICTSRLGLEFGYPRDCDAYMHNSGHIHHIQQHCQQRRHIDTKAKHMQKIGI